MKGSIPGEKISEIRDRTDIVALVSEYVTLKKAGRNLLGLCPFHQEKTPSFTVSPDKQMFYCFGCGEGGNGFDFLMKVNHMTFPEAVRHLAAKTGVVIPERVPTAVEKEQQSLREQSCRINEMAAVYFSRQLQSTVGRTAQIYIDRRGIRQDTAKAFRLGYAPDAWRSLRDFFSHAKVSLDLAATLGLIIPAKDGGFYDRFRSRLIFPIEDITGRIIAFGGRIIGEGEPKYLNSPESHLFIKGKNLYGLNRAREDIRQKDRVILVEGYFDLIALNNAGIMNVVATLGTALTREHVELLCRYTHNVAVVFDPDEAGKKALARSLELFLAGGMQVRAVILSDGHDPDDFVRTFGRERFEEVIDQSRSAVDYYIDQMIGPQRSFDDGRKAIKAATPFIAQIADPVSRNLFIKRVAERVGIDEELLKKEVSHTHPTSGTPAAVTPIKKRATPLDPLEWSLLQLMLEYPEKIQEVVHSCVLDCFLHEDLRLFGEYLERCRKEQEGRKLSIQDILGQWSDGPIKDQLLKTSVTQSPYDPSVLDRILADTMRQIRHRWFQEKHRDLAKSLRGAQDRGDQERGEELLREKEMLRREERNFGIKTIDG